MPFQASDYGYIRSLANERRRESFALSRDRGRDTSGDVAADSPWSFDGLDGGQGDGDRQALTAFPKMNKRSEDLYSAFFIASIKDATGVDVNDSVGKSSKKPYYFVQTVCDGNCQELTPEERAGIDENARASRSVISCVDKDVLAEDPFSLPLPFTPGVAAAGRCVSEFHALREPQCFSIHHVCTDGELSEDPTTVSSFDDLIGAAVTGQPTTYITPGAEADQAAAEADSESEEPLDELFVPAPALPPVAVVPTEVLSPSPIPAVTPDPLLPDEVPTLAPEPDALLPAAPLPASLAPAPIAPAPGDLPAMGLPPDALQPDQPPQSDAPVAQSGVPGFPGMAQSPRGLDIGGNGDGDGDDGGGGVGDGGDQGTRGGPGVDAGVESNQAETDMTSPASCAATPQSPSDRISLPFRKLVGCLQSSDISPVLHPLLQAMPFNKWSRPCADHNTHKINVMLMRSTSTVAEISAEFLQCAVSH